jgi:hypothetical protein
MGTRPRQGSGKDHPSRAPPVPWWPPSFTQKHNKAPTSPLTEWKPHRTRTSADRVQVTRRAIPERACLPSFRVAAANWAHRG